MFRRKVPLNGREIDPGEPTWPPCEMAIARAAVNVAACTPQWPRLTELWRMEVAWRGWEQAAPIVEYWRLCGTTSCPCYFLSSIGVPAKKISARPPNDCYWTFALPFAVAPSALPTGLSWGEERESIWFLKDNYKRL